MICSACGASLPDGKKFCTGCGTKVTAAPSPPPEPSDPSIVDDLREGLSEELAEELAENVVDAAIPGKDAAEAEVPAPERDSEGPSEDYDTNEAPPISVPGGFWNPPAWPDSFDVPALPGGGQAFDLDSVSSTMPETSGDEGPPPPLPPAPQPWPFQDQTSRLASQLVGGAGQEETQSGRSGTFFSRVVRAGLLDKSVYREVAADERLQGEAWMIAGLVILSGSIGVLVLSLMSFSFSWILSTLPGLLLQVIVWVVRVWFIQFAASIWLKRQTTFDQLFRPMAYAQAFGVLQFLPLVVLITVPWCLVTTTAAIRDVTGTDTVRAVVLTLVGVLGMAVAHYLGGLIV